MNQSIFLNYDRAALDREYDNRAKVTDFADYLGRYAERSLRTREQQRSHLNVAYGRSRDETLDIFPAGNDDAPVQVFFHGGYWKLLSKNEFSYVAQAFAPLAALTVVVDYALIPAVDMTELVRQCRASLAWVWRNIESFGGDPERIFVSGHSAGGHLAALMMATDWPVFDAGLPANLVRGACGISGLYDLEPIRLCFLNDDLALTPPAVRDHSPVLLARHCPGPVLLAVGDLEGPEYLRQTQDLAAAWSNPPPATMIMKDQHHFSIATQLENPDSELSRAIHEQMGIR